MFTGPNIVTEGLVLALDAGNKKSYPGSGTTWTDLSGQGNNGTLTNMPATPLDSGNGGSISFDGSNDYTQINYAGNFTLNSYTIEFFAKHNGTRDSRRTMLGFSNGGDSAFKVYNMQIWDNDFQYISFVGNNTNYTTYGFNLPDKFSNWHFFTSIITPTNIQTYVNNVRYYNSTSITLRGSFDRIWLGQRGNQYWKGWISGVKLYNRALTATEVQQNYNATKSRFGLT